MAKNKIGTMLIQVGYDKDPGKVLDKAVRMIDENAGLYEELDIICLPELYYEGDKDVFIDTYREVANRHHVNVITGSMPVMGKSGKPRNTAFVINRDGEVIGEYSKAHLFDAYDDRESDRLEAGDDLGIFDLDIGKIGMIICYDIRFPEYIRTLALKGVDALFIPAAFYRPRTDDWRILLQGAGLSNIMYIAAANQFGKRCAGRSSVIDPNGHIVSQAPDEECAVYHLMDMELEKKMREMNPVFSNRRPELYDIG